MIIMRDGDLDSAFERMEPGVAGVNPVGALASIAISLKRIADFLPRMTGVLCSPTREYTPAPPPGMSGVQPSVYPTFYACNRCGFNGTCDIGYVCPDPHCVLLSKTF